MIYETRFETVSFFFGEQTKVKDTFVINEGALESSSNTYARGEELFTSHLFEETSDELLLKFEDGGLPVLREWYEEVVSGRLNESLSDDERPNLYLPYEGGYHGSHTCEIDGETYPIKGLDVQEVLDVLLREFEELPPEQVETCDRYYNLEEVIGRFQDEVFRMGQEDNSYVLIKFHDYF